ncbi:vascular endothelial growth factor receptor 1-like isoform X19 [Sitodiplosis mosellana]|uniref:vascular endothelial growth factor receptor 1-like isoform X19 n=1 Tax=Sitodiplosis mosellana TaxID=263140 RepID=UPI0024443F58|nr:vascular endothelial growth factor receptor 1-like isoform X19 [Sitodiplosis mosellana]XP_055298879.1 vascular endothelial growth factor receptor 1-like isoform X19 [Sitodiplosis mosellana]XP_055298880.1 vascular endothelial growth factor receptor 1-like isoform X19 [Sitodiplosis mosellana]
MNNTILLNYYSHRQTNRLHTTKKASAMGRIRTCCYSKLSCTSIFYITLVLLIDSIQCITDGVAPVITPPEPDITVLPSEKVKFTCQSTEPIHWQFHEEYHLNGNQHNIHESYNHGSQYPYESTLEIDQVDYTYVGYYHCVKNLTEAEINEGLDTLVELGLASRIYLFVEDPQHPLAPVTIPVLQGNQHQDIVIPCKPTARNYDVKLIKESDESHQFESTFSPTEGYRIKLNEVTDGGSYTCHSKFDSTGEFDVHFSIHVNSGQTFVNKPNITSKTQNYGIEGGNLELKCSVEVGLGTLIYMYWFLPNNNISLEEGRAIISEPVREKHETHPELSHAVGKLIVHNLDKTKDAGFYKCMVEDSSLNRNSDLINVIKILDPDESFIDINEPTGKYKAEVASTKKEVQWIAKYAGHPIPEIVWRDTRGNEIPWSLSEDKNRKYEAIKDGKSTTLKIRQPKIGDSGFYILRGDNGQKQEERKFQLLVKEKPQLSMEDVSAKPGENAVMKCNIYGYPASSVTWSFIPCSKPEFDSNSCDESKKIKYNETMAVQTLQTHLFNQTSTFTFIPESTGIVICKAKNTEGKTNATAKVIINDLNEELSVWSPNTLPISIGDDVSVVCGASDHKYSQELMWYKDNVPVVNSDNVEVISEETKFSHRREIRWKSIDGSASGQYECRANVIGGTVESKMFELDVVQPQKPEIDPNFKSGGVSKKPVGEPIKLKCQFRGIPTPQLTWYKNGNEIRPDVDDKHITLDDNGTVLHLHYTKAEDEGKYKCVAINRIGSTSHETTLKMTGLPTVSVAFIVSVIAVILVLAICTIYLCIRIRRERRLFRELKAAGLANFEEGNPESINPDLALDEQADLLPYDKKYEFPREKIKLGKQLGAGAFGVVIKGIAQGIVPYEEETTVAVKMVKKMADNEVMRALISELKIMVHLGQHLNVVNLLGAVTKNIAQREVMVIVEYCRFGNLQNFLVKHRRYFIDQIVRDKDIIDPSIQTRDPRWSNDSGYSYFNRPDTDRQSVVNSAYIRHSNAGDYFPGGMDSANTEATLLSRNTHPGGEENPAMSDSQPGWRSNYQSDYKGPSRSVTTTDLLCWAFQVARGMEYLASRKVLHGDLAARNILLCDDNVVKICDFGLARSMYKTDNYRKKGEAPLPFKWLALESISDQVFSTYSDVWSFGIVLWELFSLGKVPYPGMDADQALYFKLKDGYRMEKPDFATQDIYDIMLSCWCTNPESRPLFDDLEKSVSKLLENGVAEHYIDLNEPYLKSNVSHFNEGQTDYIALMGAPDCQAPRTPNQYVNSHVITMQDASNAQSQPDYLAMSPPVDVNSPRPDGLDTHDSHFPFAGMNSPTIVNNLNASQSSPKLRNKISNIPEEIPMLKRSNQSFHSDSDSELNTTDVVESIPVTNTPRKNVNVLNTMADNYVNVPSSKVTNNKDAVSNPGYVTVSNINETRT